MNKKLLSLAVAAILVSHAHAQEDAGDVTTVPYKQIVISMGEGAKASLAAFEYLLSHEVVESEQESEAA